MYKSKEISPMDTIIATKSFLYSNNIFCTETWYEAIDGLSSVFLKIEGTSFFSNGKGINKVYALASAYGELMERLQNLSYFRIKTNIYYNDNIFNSNNSEFDMRNINKWYSKINYLNKDNIESMKKYLYDNLLCDKKKLPVDEFHNQYRYEDTINIPSKLVDIYYGTNGMSAGNTKYEALVQGLSEIIERYVNRKIIEDKITPPNININIIKKIPHIYKALQEIQEDGVYTIEIKDLSLNMDLPAIGLILYNKNDKSYFVKVGVHPIREIAIERCFTELMQGKNLKKYYGMTKIGYNHGKADSKENALKIFVNGSGIYPYELFGTNYSYESRIELNNFETNEEMYEYLCSIVKKLGYDIFIKDCTISPLRAYHIIVPGMSEIIPINDCRTLEYLNDCNKYFNIIRDILRINEERALFIIKHLTDYYNDFDRLSDTISSISLIKKNKYYDIYIIQFKILVYRYLNDYTSLIKSLKLLNSKIKHNDYYSCFENVLIMLEEGKHIDYIKKLLNKFYSNLIIDRVVNDMYSNPFNDFDSIECFECSQCSLKEECYYKNELELYNKIIKLSLKGEE